MHEERQVFKQLNGSYYHPTQRFWSLPNTDSHKKQVAAIFGKKLKQVSIDSAPLVPEIIISEEIQMEMDRHYQKMRLKNYSDSTIRSYQSNLIQFFSYFKNADLATLTKEQIDGFAFWRVIYRSSRALGCGNSKGIPSKICLNDLLCTTISFFAVFVF